MKLFIFLCCGSILFTVYYDNCLYYDIMNTIYGFAHVILVYYMPTSSKTSQKLGITVPFAKGHPKK